MKQSIQKIALIGSLLSIFLSSAAVHAAEIGNGNFSLVYANEEQLSTFNQNLKLMERWPFRLAKSNVVTIEDEVLDKLQSMLEAAEMALDMYPKGLRFRVVLLDDNDGVLLTAARDNRTKFINTGSYYSSSDDSIYCSAERADYNATAHELSHAIVDKHYSLQLPSNVYELLAQSSRNM